MARQFPRRRIAAPAGLSASGRFCGTERNVMALCCVAATAIVALSFASPAQAKCDLTSFGQHPTPPSPIAPPPVDNQYANFEWGTDAYRDRYDNWWVWNFIRNGANALKLPVNWVKGHISASVSNPLPSGFPACYREYLGTEPTTDPDAPIIYGVNAQNQNAVVYVASNGSQASRNATQKDIARADSRIETTYTDENSVIHEVDVALAFYGDPGKFSFAIDNKPSDIFIGISRLVTSLSKEDVESIAGQFNTSGMSLRKATLSDFAPQAVDELLQLASADKDRLAGLEPKAQYLFFTGATFGSANFRPPAAVSAERSAAVVVILDPRRRPICAVPVSVVIPQLGSRP
jgi:hypothetical protein